MVSMAWPPSCPGRPTFVPLATIPRSFRRAAGRAHLRASWLAIANQPALTDECILLEQDDNDALMSRHT